MRIFGLVLLLALTACATPTTYPEQRPTITFECTAACTATYTDPRDRPALPTNGWDAAISITHSLMGGLPIVGMGYVAIEGFKRLEGSGAVTNTDASTVTNRSTDNSTDYSGNRGRINSNDDYTHTPTIVTQPPPIPQPAPVIVYPAIVTP